MWPASKPDRRALPRRAAHDRDIGLHVRKPVKQVGGLDVDKAEHEPELMVLNCLLRGERI
jgi:hypothetical protein